MDPWIKNVWHSGIFEKIICRQKPSIFQNKLFQQIYLSQMTTAQLIGCNDIFINGQLLHNEFLQFLSE